MNIYILSIPEATEYDLEQLGEAIEIACENTHLEGEDIILVNERVEGISKQDLRESFGLEVE